MKRLSFDSLRNLFTMYNDNHPKRYEAVCGFIVLYGERYIVSSWNDHFRRNRKSDFLYVSKLNCINPVESINPRIKDIEYCEVSNEVYEQLTKSEN